MKNFLPIVVVFVFLFSSCGLLGWGPDPVRDDEVHDVNIEGPFLFTNGQKLLLSEKCYYKGFGKYECGLAALGLAHGLRDANRNVYMYHNGTMDFSDVRVKTKGDSSHGILSYVSDRSYSGRNDVPLYYGVYVIFFDDIDMLKGTERAMEDNMLILADSSGVVDVEIEDSEKNIVHLVYKMFLPEVMNRMSYEDGGFTLNHEKIELILDYCFFAKDSIYVSDSLLQVCLDACPFCDGMYPLLRFRRNEYKTGVRDLYQSYRYNKNLGQTDQAVLQWIEIGCDWAPSVYYKP